MKRNDLNKGVHTNLYGRLYCMLQKLKVIIARRNNGCLRERRINDGFDKNKL